MKEFEKSWGAIEPNYLIELKSETAILNMRRTRLFLESILALQIMTYGILFVVSVMSATYEFHYRNSLLLFFGLLIFSVIEYFIVGHLETLFIERRITTETINKNLWVVVGFITSWSALLSVMSSGNDTMNNLFMLSLMITSFMFYIDARPQAAIYGISIGIYLIGHYAFGSRALVTMDFLNLMVFALLAWIVSRINYQSYIGFYKDQCIINDKNELLQEINTDLSHEIVEKQEILRELEAANATLKKISAIDDLTSVPNRRKLNEVVHYEWRRSQRERNDIAIFMIDIDHFKSFNDTYGHVYGDEVLRKVATELNRFSMRPTDFFARYGGEEFTFLAINMSKENVLHFANRMRAAVEGLKIIHDTSDTNKYLTISIGVTIAQPYNEDRVEKAFNRSDMALYLCKKDGRNTMRYIDFKDQLNCEKGESNETRVK